MKLVLIWIAILLNLFLCISQFRDLWRIFDAMCGCFLEHNREIEELKDRLDRLENDG